MKIKDIFIETKENLKFGNLVLFDDWSDDGDLITIFRDGEDIVIQVLGFFSQEIKKKGVGYKNFKNMRYKQFKRIIDELTEFSFEQMKMEGYDDMLDSFHMIY